MERGMTRRRFIEQLGRAGLGCAALPLIQLGMRADAAAQGRAADPDYRALVCILLAGGNDSFNMVVPRDPAEYAGYEAARSDLALARDSLLPIRPRGLGREYGFHPSMPEVQRLFDEDRLAVLANAGTLVERVTLEQIDAGAARVPLGLYSHADQIRQWQTSLPDSRSTVGWGGRVADLFEPQSAGADLPIGISLSGTNVFQSGEGAVEYAITAQGSVGIDGFDDDDPFQRARADTIRALANGSYRNLLKAQFGATLERAIRSHEVFTEAIAAGEPVDTVFSPGPLSQSLRMVARTIAARGALGAPRQTFFVTFGGWDHHDELLNNQAGMLATLSRALLEFDTALAELGVRDDVTTFTISDFGRTLSSNGRGSDHGWGGNQLVMGGSVLGGEFHGDYPALEPGNPLDTGRGRLIPTLATDEVFAELALWFGVRPDDLPGVLPNVTRFVDPGSTSPPVGFLRLV
ncbi:MAG: DUF1501 domain-containing protein [Myxococcota bacterium]|nr:DUF1501 domain-containing protein [Myxococcota bacterium]